MQLLSKGKFLKRNTMINMDIKISACYLMVSMNIDRRTKIEFFLSGR